MSWSRRRKVVTWVVGVLALLLVGAGAFALVAYRHYDDQIGKAPIMRTTEAPAKVVAGAQNILLMGSDTRTGQGDAKFGRLEGARSDTTILLHVSADHRRAVMVSIPRDSWVQIPACRIGPNGETSEPTMAKFNEAFSIGADAGGQYAPSCTVATVESLTGIKIDHYAVIDFAGFQRVVDALGGVRMCVAEPLQDPVVTVDGETRGSGLDLPAGKDVLIDGEQALALMRARYALDGGGDLPRIKRQQLFIGAVVRKAFSSGLLVDVPKLLRLMDAATSSLTTDGLGLGEIRGLASVLHDIGPENVTLLTVPLLDTLPPGVPTADVAWDPVRSKQLWQALLDDRPVAKEPGPSASATPSATPTVQPSDTTSAAQKNCLS